jgi:hypothetical protein
MERIRTEMGTCISIGDTGKNNIDNCKDLNMDFIINLYKVLEPSLLRHSLKFELFFLKEALRYLD